MFSSGKIGEPNPTIAFSTLNASGIPLARKNTNETLTNRNVISQAATVVTLMPVGLSLGLSPALHALAARRRYLALSIAGRRYDIGARYGLLFAQLALSLSGRDRDRVLTQVIELLAVRPD
jgi:hypothetical protein